MGIEEDFAKALEKDPKLIEKLVRKAEFDDFKSKYKAERASPLKCPACSQWGQTGGSLWIKKGTTNEFVCRRCKLEFVVECRTISNEDLFTQLRKVAKGE